MSTYSTNLKLELIANGAQSGTWGTTTNNNLGTLLEQAIAGVQNITISSANYVLTNLNGITDEARNAVIVVNGTPSGTRTVLVPNGQTKIYVVVNNTSGGYSVNVQTWTGSGLTGTGNIAVIQPGASILIYCTGSNCYAVAPYTAYTAVPVVVQGYASGTTLTVTSVTSGTLAPGQTIYNPGILYTPSGFPSGTTIDSQTSGTTGGVGVYVITSIGANLVGTVNTPQTIVALATLNQIATVDYTQSKMQSPYFQGQPSADTATAAAFEGQLSTTGTYTGVLIASKYYVLANPLVLGQYLNGSYISDGAYVSSWGTGTTGNATFSGYISANQLTVITGTITGTITNNQYLEANGTNLAVGTKISGGSELTWSISGPAQTVGSATSPVTFNAYGPLTNQTDAYNASVNNTGGWVNVQNDLQPMATSIRTPMISYLSPLQLANVLWASNISSLVGTLGTQSDTAVNILGGTIANTVIGGTTPAAGNFTTLTANSIPSIGQYDAIYGSASTWYNAGLRNDGYAVYLLSSAVQTTQAAAATASFNAYRPYSWNLSTGTVTIDGTGAGATFGGRVTAGSFAGNGALLTNLPGLGFGQTWQTVTGSRAWNTLFTNSTGKPIMVSATNYASDGGLTAYVSNVIIAQTGQSGGTGNDVHNLIFIVPVGATYQLDPIRFVGAMLWTELS